MSMYIRNYLGRKSSVTLPTEAKNGLWRRLKLQRTENIFFINAERFLCKS